MHWCYKAALVVCCLLLIIGVAWGQGSVGTLNGTVLDAVGAVVPGAVVTITNVATGVEAKTTTTSAGAYTFPYVPSGNYTIKVTAAGFRVASAENVILRVAQTLTVNISLEVGQLTESVTVSATPPLLEAGTAEMGRYISTEEYKSWPIFLSDGQRQLQDFIFTSLPGTTGETFQGSINGGQNYSHEILIEGISIGRSDLSGGNNSEFSPSAEAVSEFKMQTGAISAQYNGGQTAVANFAIKSGTNTLHGSGFLYLSNEALNSLSLSDKVNGKKKTKSRENNEGYSLGGPVYIPKIYNGKNRTFFFTNLEKDHYDSMGFSGFTTLPTPEFKQGDFSGLLNPAYTGNALSGTQVGTDALGRPILYGEIFDPKSTRVGPDGNAIRDPLAGNKISPSAFDPVAANILKMGIPDPTYQKMINNIDKVSGCCPFFDLHTIGVKIDHNIAEKHHFTAYYNHSYRNRQQNADTGKRYYAPAPGLLTSPWKYQYAPGRMARTSFTSTLTPTIVNRVAAGFNRFYNQNGARPETINQGWAEKLGIQNTSDAFFPTFNFSGTQYQSGTLAQIGSGGLYPSANGSWVFQDDLTWVRGAHTFHFGYQYNRYYYNERSPDGSGAFKFTPTQTDMPGYAPTTGNAFASFLLGAVSSANRGINPLSSGFRQPQHAFYAMDDWKVTPKLTLNAGLRWEIIPPFFERTGRVSYIDLTTPNPDAGNLPGALVFGKNPSTTYWKEFGPRLGFAYQATDKMVIRAGYAMLNTPPIRNDWGYGGFTYGYNASVSAKVGQSPTGFVDDPSMYLSQPFPSLKAVLPDTNPSSGNFDAYQTTAPDANRPAYTQNWNFTIQYQLPRSTVVEVAYVGNKGTRLWGHSSSSGFGQLNGVPASFLSLGDTLNDKVSDHPELIPYAGFPAGDYTVAQALRPHPQYIDVIEAFPYNTNSLYNSLQVTLTRHLTNGLGFIGAYTWSKTLGYVDGSGPGDYYVYVQDPYNRKLERSITTFNYPQNFKLTWVYDLPFGKGKRFDLHFANWVLGGWEFAATQGYHSGAPLSVSSSGLNTPAGFGSIRPDVILGQPLTLGGAPSSADYNNGTPYINPAAFQNVPMTTNGVPLRTGFAPRIFDGLRGPRSASEQVRMSKTFPIKERATVAVGVSATNPFNRVFLNMGSMTVGDGDFGTVYARGSSHRTVQLDARIEF